MDSYEVIITPDAAGDLTELRDYIVYTLHAHNTAISYIQAVRKEIESLSIMPARNKTLDDEPWHSRGIRKIMAKNFYIYYRIDENAGRIYVLSVIYAKRDQLKMLNRKNDN